MSIRCQLHHEVYILGEAQEAVCVHRQAAHDQVAYAGVLERAHDGFEAHEFHEWSLVAWWIR